GALRTNLLAGLVSLRVRDSDSSFNATVQLTNCMLMTADRIHCKSAQHLVVVVLHPVHGPFLYNMRIAAIRLGSAATGAGALTGPVTVNLVACTNTGTARRDTIGNCVQLKGSRLRCIEN